MKSRRKKFSVSLLFIIPLLLFGIAVGVILLSSPLNFFPKATDTSGGTGSLANNAITALYYQHWETNRPQIVQNFPKYYSMLTNATYNADQYVPTLSPPIIAQYVESTNAMIAGAHEAAYPIYFDTLKNNELTFVHSTNPAEITISQDSTSFNIYWKYDERYTDYPQLQYSIYRLSGNNLPFSTKSLWNQSWKTLSWQKIATVNAATFGTAGTDAGKFMFYVDYGYNKSNTNCWLIKTVRNGTEQFYSLPVCQSTPSNVNNTGVTITHSDIQLSSKKDLDALYSNNTYQITAVADSNNFSNPQVILYGQDGGTKITDNQFAYNFHEVAKYPMVKTNNKATLTLTLKRPYLLYKSKSSGFTEEPTIRIQVTDVLGNIRTFPSDEGYLVLAPNNKLTNRFWTGYPANPASTEWQTKMISVIKNMKSKKYNAVFLDNWSYRLFDIASNGTNFDAPAIEFHYPANWTSTPGFTDPTTLAMDQLGRSLKTAVPDMLLFGNSLNPEANSPRILSAIDGGMFEACIHSGNQKITGQNLVNTFTVLEKALNEGKRVICLSTFGDGHTAFDANHRLYTLGSYLLAAQNKTSSKMYYGHNAFQSSWGPGVNDFPEYLVDIGNPTAARQSLGTYIWKRSFEKGTVYVNASTTPYTINFPTTAYQVVIADIVVNKNSSGSIISANPGKIRYQERSASSTFNLAPESAIILLENPTIPQMSSLQFEAEAGWSSISSPDFYFVVKDGKIYQNNSNPDPGKSAKVQYWFSVPTAGTYKIKMKVNAYHEWVNSLLVNVDADAGIANMWTVSPLTNGLEERYIPKTFNLSAGRHLLTIRGHEPVAIDSIAIEASSSPTSNQSPTPQPTPQSTPQPATIQNPITIQAETGSLTNSTPDFYFVVKDGKIYQNNSNPDPAKCAKAQYQFELSTAGTYKIKMKVNAYHEWVNSLLVNVDADAGIANMWTVSPLTNGLEDRYLPKTFNLSAGKHTLIIRGHEPVAIDYITIEKAN